MLLREYNHCFYWNQEKRMKKFARFLAFCIHKNQLIMTINNKTVKKTDDITINVGRLLFAARRQASELPT